MAAGVLPMPGSEFLCESCLHTDCAYTRNQAMTACGLCSRQIGYGSRFYREDEFGLVHELCLLEKVKAT